MSALFHGELQQGYRYHPLVFLILPAATLFGASGALTYVRTGAWGHPPTLAKRITPIALTLATLMVLLWAARFLGAFGGPAPAVP
jgi:Protein of unknown function (DUF2752)